MTFLLLKDTFVTSAHSKWLVQQSVQTGDIMEIRNLRGNSSSYGLIPFGIRDVSIYLLKIMPMQQMKAMNFVLA